MSQAPEIPQPQEPPKQSARYRRRIPFRHPRIERMVSEEDMDIGGRLFPMAGVSFLILLILMMGARDLMSKSKIPVDVPKVQRIEAEMEEHIAITLTRDGSLYVNDRPVTYEELPEVVERLQREDPDSTFWYTKLVLIRADRNLPFGDVLRILDAAKKGKSLRVAFAVIKEKRELAP